MTVRQEVPLAQLTTFKVGGPARFVCAIESETDLISALTFVREQNLPFVILGEGSNILPPDEGYSGVILLMRIPGITFEDQGEYVRVAAGAGVVWDDLVSACADRGLWGIENLAGIPGTVGAAPVQNIGAYGAEVKNVIEKVIAYDVRENQYRTLQNAECGFSYRDSRFKHEPQLIIVTVTFLLAKTGVPQVEYKDLIAVRETGGDLSAPGAIGSAVREIRARKFPDLREFGTAGSFFKNPILTQEKYDQLSATYADIAGPLGGIPRYPMPGAIKIPLAFILDKVLGMRGHRRGPTFLFGNQPLVLVADQEATARDIDALAREIEMRVHDATGITIEREVRNLTSHESTA